MDLTVKQPATALLSTAYFAPIQWYQKVWRFERCIVEQHDHFVKQTYRNRCLIATTQGVQALIVPTEKATTDKQLMCDVRISSHGKWQQEHWNALLSAYGESAFYDYYIDDLRPFFEQQWDFLLDFNMAINETLCRLLDIDANISLSEQYTQEATHDFRDAIRPKHPLTDDDFKPKKYYQVYQKKHGFIENLSILDLLFNMGPESIFYL